MRDSVKEFLVARKFLAAKLLVLALIPAIAVAVVLSEVDGFWSQTLNIHVELSGAGDIQECQPAKSKGYWKNHEDHVAEMLIQGPFDLGDTVVMTVGEAVEVLSNASAKDAKNSLRAQLMATLLNLRNGSNPLALGPSIGPTADAAIDFLATHPEPVKGGHPDREYALDLKDALMNFNHSEDDGCDNDDDDDHGGHGGHGDDDDDDEDDDDDDDDDEDEDDDD